MNERIAFQPETITADEILREENTELRRVLLERMGFECFMQAAQSEEIDQDTDAGGVRRLLRISVDAGENYVGLAVIDPSMGRQYILWVSPHMETCHQAAAWIAGFDNPDNYNPVLET